MPFLALKLLESVFILLINVKIPTLVGILTFMSRKIFKFSGIEHEKKLYKLEARLNFKKIGKTAYLLL